MKTIHETKRLCCLSVSRLVADMPDNVRGWEIDPLPLYGFVDFSGQLLQEIKHLRTLLSEHELDEIKQKTTKISWYFYHTERYYRDVPSFLHVTPTEVYFSGAVKPYKQANFRTVPVVFSEVINESQVFRKIDMARLGLPLANGLIKELEANSEETEHLWKRKDALDDVQSALTKADGAREPAHAKFSEYADALVAELCSLEKQLQQADLDRERLGKKLLYRVFGLCIGDWIYCNTGLKSKLQIERVDYYEGDLVLYGSNITQKGLVGKRQGSCHIKLVNKDEH
ncbi:MAG: hypothetical protein C9356_02700 [Oleiphilus sp.]|nr:MAG: hypothetical protein C9356_02700 [Oleiphilus sp.]